MQLAAAEARLAKFDHIDHRDERDRERRDRSRADVAEARRHMVNAAAGVATAKYRLNGIPQEVLVPNMVSHQYPIQAVTKTVRVNCILKGT